MGDGLACANAPAAKSAKKRTVDNFLAICSVSPVRVRNDRIDCGNTVVFEFLTIHTGVRKRDVCGVATQVRVAVHERGGNDAAVATT